MNLTRNQYNDLRDPLPLCEHGFFSEDNRQMLDKIIADIKPMRVVEVGTWCGLSAAHMARAVKPWGGHVFCVDIWKPVGQVGQYAGIIPHPYKQFLSNVIHWGLTDDITPMRMTSLEASEVYPEDGADLIYIDADHGYESTQADILAWWKCLRKGGVMCGDDIQWGGVREGILKACEKIGAELLESTMPHFWSLAPKP